MSYLNDLNLIRVFGFYLLIMFLASMLRRYRLYHMVGEMIASMPKRWPKLLEVIKQQRLVFLTGATLWPTLVMLVVTVLYMISSRLIFPQADVRLDDILDFWWLPLALGIPGGMMLALDLYGIIQSSWFDRSASEQYLDEAEYWLRSWKAPVVKIVTLGYINPRRMVADEVYKALLEARSSLHYNLWWITVQMSLRISFGLALWSVWAFHPGI